MNVLSARRLSMLQLPEISQRTKSLFFYFNIVYYTNSINLENFKRKELLDILINIFTFLSSFSICRNNFCIDIIMPRYYFIFYSLFNMLYIFPFCFIALVFVLSDIYRIFHYVYVPFNSSPILPPFIFPQFLK